MTDTAQLEALIKNSKLKMQYILDELGLSRSGFWYKLKNKQPFNQFEIDTLCKLLDINVQKMMEIFFDIKE